MFRTQLLCKIYPDTSSTQNGYTTSPPLPPPPLLITLSCDTRNTFHLSTVTTSIFIFLSSQLALTAMGYLDEGCVML